MFNGENISDLDVDFTDPFTNEKIPRENVLNFLNDYFVHIGNNNQHPIYTDDIPMGLPQHAFEEVTLQEIIALVREIDITKDSCIDGINAEVLKCAFQQIPDKILLLFQRSINSGIFPREWAKGYVNILPKSGKLSDPVNWRPITQTCIPAKLLEKTTQTRLMKTLLHCGEIDENQFGFVPNCSKQSAVMETVCDLYHAMNLNLLTGLLFLDVRKAFDSLNHKILLSKLKNIGLEYNIIAWFNSYLDRKQVLRYKGVCSDELNIISGIPQGSILGPTLFIFYINAIFSKIPDVKIKMFADDCVLYKSGVLWNDVHPRLQHMLDEYILWGSDHCLQLNADKTKCMIVANRGKLKNIYDPAPFNGGNRQIMFVKRYSYLGIILDDEMSLEPLYKNVCRQVEQKLFMQRKIRRHITRRAAVSLYKQMILPLFDYSGFLLLSYNVYRMNV